jgi:hypothetical protein
MYWDSDVPAVLEPSLPAGCCRQLTFRRRCSLVLAGESLSTKAVTKDRPSFLSVERATAERTCSRGAPLFRRAPIAEENRVPANDRTVNFWLASDRVPERLVQQPSATVAFLEIGMSEAVRITTEVPSVEETARVAGVPLSRAKKLGELARMSRVESRRSPRLPAVR